MKNKLILFITIFIIASFNSLFSQSNINQEVHVVKPYEPSISDAFKINFMPQVLDTAPVISKFNYYVEAIEVPVEYEPEQIKPARVTGEPLQPLYKTYLKGGAGNYSSLLGEVGINVLRNKEYNAGIFFKHSSSNSKIKLENDIKSPANYSDNYAIMSGERFFDETSLYGQVHFSRNVFNYYGFNTNYDTILVKDDINQRFLNIGTNVGYKSYYTDSSKFNFDVSLGYDFFEDLSQSYQNKIDLKGTVSNFYKSELLALNIRALFFNKSSLIDTVNHGVIHINPKVRFFGDKWRIETGLNMDVDAYADSLFYHYYPNVFLQYNVVDNFLIPYFGFSGGIITNDFSKIAKENPFVMPGLQVKNINNLLNVFMGFKGRFSRQSSFNLQGSYSLFDNMYFFVSNPNNLIENYFDVVYDNVELIHFRGEFAVKSTEKINMYLISNYYRYKTDTLQHPWHKPEYDFTFSFRYNMQSKIIAGFDLRTEGERYAKVFMPNPEIIKMRKIIDANLSLEYRYTKLVSFYINANNLLHRSNQWWMHYPMQRFNIMGGFTYSF